MMDNIDQKSEFLWRRLLDAPPGWVIALPVIFAFVVVFLMWAFRRERGCAASLCP